MKVKDDIRKGLLKLAWNVMSDEIKSSREESSDEIKSSSEESSDEIESNQEESSAPEISTRQALERSE
ncbi:hypothetical protein LA080_000639 [Diaporthe eres]|nr:hypothetical protein LA080_000639 [Diaporthe eres]